MGVRYSPSVVTNGLVLHLDAANSKSFFGSGTTWYDITKSANNATLINGPTFNSSGKGGFVLDGVNDRGTFTSPVSSTSPQTHEVWVKGLASPTAVDGFAYILHNNASSNFIGSSFMSIGYAGFTLQTNEIYAAFNGAWPTMGTGVIGNSTTVRHIVLTWDGTTQIAYVDGVQKASQALTAITQGFSTTTSFGDYRDSTYRPVLGTLYAVRSYNRALTVAEVRQNFNAGRSRFGL